MKPDVWSQVKAVEPVPSCSRRFATRRTGKDAVQFRRGQYELSQSKFSLTEPRKQRKWPRCNCFPKSKLDGLEKREVLSRIYPTSQRPRSQFCTNETDRHLRDGSTPPQTKAPFLSLSIKKNETADLNKC